MPAGRVYSSKPVELSPGMKRPASVISVQDGDIMVDAEFLAAKLGLSTESLKAEMRRGIPFRPDQFSASGTTTAALNPIRQRQTNPRQTSPLSVLLPPPIRASRGHHGCLRRITKASWNSTTSKEERERPSLTSRSPRSHSGTPTTQSIIGQDVMGSLPRSAAAPSGMSISRLRKNAVLAEHFVEFSQ